MPFANLSRIATSQEGPYVAPLSPQNIEELRVNEQEMTQSDGDHNNTAVCSKNGVNANGEARDGFRRQPRVMRKQFYGALAPICGRATISYSTLTLSRCADAVSLPGLLILAVFWIDMSQVYGLFYNQGKWTSKGHVAVVDFDGGFFGSSLLEAASRVNRSYGYPTYVILSPDSNSPEAIRHEVFVGKYWAALYAFPGSTERFEMAVNSTASEPYEAAQSLAYITLTARYFAFYQFNILSTSIAVTQMASGLISERAIASTLSSRSPDNSALGENALAALGHPAQPTEIPAAYADFNLANDKVFVNTIGTVMPVLMQFFFIMAWNGISNHMHVFATKGLKDHLKYRFIGSTIWPLITSLNSTGWTFTFMKSYPTNSGQFFAIWAISWLYEMITFFCELHLTLASILTDTLTEYTRSTRHHNSIRPDRIRTTPDGYLCDVERCGEPWTAWIVESMVSRKLCIPFVQLVRSLDYDIYKGRRQSIILQFAYHVCMVVCLVGWKHVRDSTESKVG